MSITRVYIQRTREFERRRTEPYQKAGDANVIGSVTEYRSTRQSDPSFQIKYDYQRLVDRFGGDPPDRVLDLVEVAVAMMGIDRYVKRQNILGEGISDADARVNTRSILVRFPVLSDVFASSRVERLISTILSHMTRDTIQFEFIPHASTDEPTRVDVPRQSTSNPVVNLFSEGLDSAGGVYQTRGEGTDASYVSLRYGSGISHAHRTLQDLLEVDPAIYRVDYEQETTEFTTFSRGFLHWVFATAHALAIGANEVRSFETGLMARFVLLNEGWHTTRTVSPLARKLFNTLLAEELDLGVEVINPFIGETKREVIERITDEAVVRASVSCPHHIAHRKFKTLNCGQCGPCIVRNLSLLASRFEIPPAELSVCDWSQVDFERRVLPEQSAEPLVGRNDPETFFIAIGEIGYLCRQIRNQPVETVAAEHPRLGSESVYALHQRFSDELHRAVNRLQETNPTAAALIK